MQFLKCQFGEQGELIVRIDVDGPISFDGYYKNTGATKKKILSNVFVKGDKYVKFYAKINKLLI